MEKQSENSTSEYNPVEYISEYLVNIKGNLKKELFLELSGHKNAIVTTTWSSNVGPLVDLCAAVTKFNECKNVSECERHRFISILSKSLQLLNENVLKSGNEKCMSCIKDIMLECAELYTDIKINREDN